MTEPFTLASWNVNSIKARLAHVQNFLADKKPDMLFLQELKGETLPEISSDYQVVFKGQKAYNGVAILSKHPVSLITNTLSGDDEDFQARYLETEWSGIRFICIYLPNGNPIGTDKFSYKINWMKRLVERVKTLRENRIPFVIGGDFNVIPSDKDCYDPTVWRQDALYHPETIHQFRRLMNLGLTDAFQVFNENAQEYTFWDYQAGAWPMNKGIRIDHFLTSPTMTDRLLGCSIDKTPRGWDTPSDHTPILVQFRG
jgi:exodeoxyribonuclease-3